jgi:hypothetical protein
MKLNQLKEIIREELENALQSKGSLSLGKGDSYSVVNDYPQLVKVLMDYVEMNAPKTTNRLGKTILGDKVTITPQKLGQLPFHHLLRFSTLRVTINWDYWSMI